jgi:hypothetical protein
MLAPTTASPFADRAVFIIGMPRSGTTWLGQLLQAHPEVVGLDAGESRLFVALRHLWRNHARADGEGISTLVGRAELVGAVRRYCDGLFATDAGTHFVEKTPAHSFHLPTIREVYPDAWIIHLVRDARDVVRSLSELEFGQPDVRRGALSWARGERIIARDTAGMARYRNVRYEDLVADPVGVAADLMRWVGLPVDEAVVDAIAPRVGVRVAQFTDARVAPKRASLGPDEMAAVLVTAGPELVRLGYLADADLQAAHRTPEGRRARRAAAVRRWLRWPRRRRSS